MYDDLSESPGHFRFRSAGMIISAVIFILFFGIGLRLLLSIILGDIESDIGRNLFLAVWITLVGLSVVSIMTGVEARSDELVICFLFLKSRHIPWHDIHEARIRHRNGQWCVIKYGENPAKEIFFIVDYIFPQGRERCNRLLTVITNNAQLQQVGKNHWGSHVDKYN